MERHYREKSSTAGPREGKNGLLRSGGNADIQLVKLSFRCVLVLLLGIWCGVGQSQSRDPQPWIKLTTPKFELYTNAGNAKAKDLLDLLEGAESTAICGSNAHRPENRKPLRVIAFANESEYAPFGLNPAALGHYLHAGDRDYIVLPDAEPEHYEAAVHEYTHYAVNRAGFHLPLWLNEGIADLYSTTSSKTGSPVLGGPLSGRLSTLSSRHLSHLSDLFVVERGLSLYENPEKATLFYAESWALTHLLALDSHYAAQFPELLAKLSAGSSSADALWSVYRKTPEQFEAELLAYIRQIHAGRPVLEMAGRRQHLEPAQTTVSEFERRIIWADLLAAHPSTAARAKEQLLELEKQFPDQPETEERLGHLAWHAQRSDEAQIHWAKAVELGSRDFEVLYRYALLLHASGAPCSQAIALMEKAVLVKPDSEEVIYNLGVLKYGEGEYEGASETLLRLRKVAPEQAYTYYSVLAYCQMKMKTFDRAKAFLLKAAESARTAEEQAENSRMLRFAAVRAD